MREIPNSQIHHTGAEAHPRRLAGPWNPDPNGGFYAKHVLTPDDVSFGRLELHELGHGAVWTAEVGAGTIAVFGPTGTALLGQTHGTPNGARPGTTDMEKWFWGDMPPLLSAPITHSAMYNHHLPGVGTVIGKDKVYNAILGVRNQFVDSDIPETVVHAGAYIEIELHARISGATAGANAAEIPNYRLGTNTHRIQLTRNGTLTISKGGISETFRRDHPNLGDPAPP
jgi:hypothetical protein